MIGAAVLFGTSGTASELLIPDASSASIAAWRLIIGAVGLVVLTRGFAFVHLYRSPLIWVMGLGVAAFQFFFFLSVSLAGVAVGTLITVSAAPWCTGLLGWAWNRIRPSRVWWAATAIGVVGLVLLVGRPPEGNVEVGGIAAGLTAAASYAVYTNIGTRLTSEGRSSTSVLAASFALSGVILLPFALTSGSWIMTGSGITAALWLGLVGTTLGYWLFGRGMRVLNAGTIGTLNLAEPLVATILAVTVLGESISAIGVIGCTLILLALVVLARSVTEQSTKSSGSEVVNT
jgi:DME family drug/metabolite transporter